MATLATDLSCSTLIRRELHPLGWIKRFHCLIINSPSSELFPTRRRSVPTDSVALAGTPCHRSSGCLTCDTRPAFPPSESAPAAPVVVDRHLPEVPCATDPTADPVAQKIPPDSAIYTPTAPVGTYLLPGHLQVLPLVHLVD